MRIVRRWKAAVHLVRTVIFVNSYTDEEYEQALAAYEALSKWNRPLGR